ncbi:olfactory receptor 52Z1P-like [Pseudophryne corroboree]|uniref:olfactory receptor 52Z1P-like n=1 Tax=Pseudophryne corroboree TaxID=495146 RepID=UPI003081C941
MNHLNHSSVLVSHTEFVLLGFPGILDHRKLLAIPFLFIYVTILAGNSLIIYRIGVENSLHSPMYFFITVLFAVNVSCTTSVIPKLILGLSFGMNQISLGGCLVQMFYIYFLAIFESGLILSMALDRYVAICRPLRYNDIMTKNMLVQLVLIGMVRSFVLASPMVILASRVQYCRSNVILNFVCENMGLLSLACGDITPHKIVGLSVRVLVTGVDVSLLLLSYSSILYTAMKIVIGKARGKALHTCGTHLLVAMVLYMSALSSSVLYRMDTIIAYNVQNLFNAIYLMIPATVNPFIYGLGVKEIRRCLIKSLRKKKANLPPSVSIHANRTFAHQITAEGAGDK